MIQNLKNTKFFIFLPLLAAAITLCSCQSSQEAESPESILSQEAFQESVGSESVIYYVQDDFDGDGDEEAFGITGELNGSIEDTDLYDGVSIYFLHADGEAEVLMEDTFGCIRTDILIDTGSAKFLIWEVYWGGSSSTSYIFGVIDGEAYEPDISGQYSWFAPVEREDGLYYANTTEFGDEGHEWIDHYFTFDDESGQFTETE